jgi:predicted O-methyltransferase YrrM
MSEWKMPRESDFTAPTKRCPHPEYWESENAYATEKTLSELVAAFVRAMQPEFVLEVGSHYGQTTALVGKAIRANGHGKFVSLEIDKDLYGSACNRCWDVPEACIINVNSLDYIPEQPIDLLFIDGQQDRVLDVKHFSQYCAKYAIVIIHDMLSAGYIDQVESILDELGTFRIFVNSPRGMMIVGLNSDYLA